MVPKPPRRIRVLQIALKTGDYAPPGPVLLAVSGGADSVALMRMMAEESAPPAAFFVAHFNHRIRGAESDADEAFVREQAESLGLPFVRDSADVPAIAAAAGESVEMAARRLRHGFFQKAARENACVAIATGHSADDRLETFFMRLARGSSLRGLSGGAAACETNIPLIKPLREYRHGELVAWLESRGFPWREDSSNTSMDYGRNRVRGILVPAFEKALGASAVKSALRTMELLRADNEYLETLAQNARSATKSCRELAALPLPVFNRVAADFLYSLPVEPELITSKTLAIFRGMVSTPPRGTKRMPVAQGWGIERVGDELRITDGEDDSRKTNGKKSPVLRIATNAKFTAPPRSSALEAPLVFYVNSRIDPTKITLRAPKPGDRISPAGSGITQKISDIVQNLKIPRERRKNILVAVNADDEIIALPGYATAEQAKVPAGESGAKAEIVFGESG